MRKKTIRRALALLIICSVLPLLSACHGKQAGTAFSVPEAFDDETPVEIVFWAKNDSNKNQVAVYERAISGFQTLYPNVTVTMRKYTDYGRIYNDVITNIATDTTPNVCITYPDHIATYLNGQDSVVALDSLMTDPRFGLGGSEVRFDGPGQDEIVPEFLNECRIGDVVYAMPFMRSTEALYINRDYVEKLGYEVPETVTWDFVWEVSEKAMEKDEEGVYQVNGQKVMIPFIYKSTDNMMISMLKQLNAPYSTDAGEILLFNDTAKGLLKEIYTHARSGAFSTFSISGYPANFLNAGRCIFAIDSTAGATWMGSGAPLLDIPEKNIVSFTTEVRPIPQSDPDHLQMISQGPSVCVFNKENRQEVLASWLFVQYLLSNEIQLGYAETEGYLPVTSKAWNSPEYQDYLSRIGEDDAHYDVKIRASNLLREHIGDTFVTPVFSGSASVRSAAGQMIEETVKRAQRKGKISDEWFGTLFDNMTSLYRLEQHGADSTRNQGYPRIVTILFISVIVTWAVILLVRGIEKRKSRIKNGKQAGIR